MTPEGPTSEGRRTDRERIDRLFAELDRVVDDLMLDELEAALRRARQALGIDA